MLFLLWSLKKIQHIIICFILSSNCSSIFYSLAQLAFIKHLSCVLWYSHWRNNMEQFWICVSSLQVSHPLQNYKCPKTGSIASTFKIISLVAQILLMVAKGSKNTFTFKLFIVKGVIFELLKFKTWVQILEYVLEWI